MKKILLTICFAVIAVASMYAAKANSLPVVVTQPDGTQLAVVLHGDENVNWYTTLDGTLLVKDGEKYLVAEVMNDGSLKASDVLAHSPLMRSQVEINLVLTQNKTAFTRYAEARLGQPGLLPMVANAGNGLTKQLQIRNDRTLFPHVGSPKALVILAEFEDTTFTIPNPKASFNDYLNNDTGNIAERGYGESRNPKGVRGYFKDMSFGKFTPEFDIVGPVRLNHPLSYYGEGYDHMNLFIPDVCKAVDDSVDFSKYDSNGDGVVDLVYVIYAGHSQSESGNSSIDIWPKSGTGNFGTYDGKRVYRYGVNNELNGRETSRNKLINGIGLFCHEFSHCLGLPDIYATSGSTGYNQDNFGMEFWDLMDGGEYVSSGRYPTAYTAWEREVTGWTTVDTLTDTLHVAITHLDKHNTDSARAYKIINESVKNEAFYLQNIQNKGWNSRLPGHGLLVYRVSYGRDSVYFNDNPNNGVKPRVVCVPADGKLGAMASYAGDSSPANYYADMAGDTYPGTTNTDSILGFVTYAGDTIAKPVLNITEEDGVISFDFLGVKTPPLPDVINGVKETKKLNDNRIYSITGQYLGTDKSKLSKGIYIVNRKKVMIGK